tara:strand:- start:8539 stop:8697 length:159 start_codon:yes stop_codon:yes gene_type:complete
MIKTFDTSTTTPSGKSGGSTNLVIAVILTAAIGYAAYKFWYLPRQEKNGENR